MTAPSGPERGTQQLRRHLRLPRPTIRLRLTLLYGALALASGAVLLALTYLLVGAATGGVMVSTDTSGQTVITYSGVAGAGVTRVQTGMVVTGPGSVAAPDPGQIQSFANAQQTAQMNQLLIWSLVALGIMAVVSIGVGWLVAGRVLDPVRTMTRDVRELSAASLHRRLMMDGPDDELSELGATFNDLLARLEASFQAQRAFVANASHELRTPLARQRTLLQVALDDPEPTVESLREAGERALVAGDQQERLIEALLMLARSERGLERREPVDVTTLVADALLARRPDVESHQVRLRSRLGPAATRGDPRLLERLVANLVDNAIRYNEAGGWVEVSTGSRRSSVFLAVANGGPVVPASEVTRLLEPFQRMDAERMLRSDGWGLGLSIVRAIAVAHGGSVNIDARPDGGLTVEITLPGIILPT